MGGRQGGWMVWCGQPCRHRVVPVLVCLYVYCTSAVQTCVLQQNGVCSSALRSFCASQTPALCKQFHAVARCLLWVSCAPFLQCCLPLCAVLRVRGLLLSSSARPACTCRLWWMVLQAGRSGPISCVWVSLHGATCSPTGDEHFGG